MEENQPEHPPKSMPSQTTALRVVFAPDFRNLGPYQQLLGESAEARGRRRWSYLTGYRRGMPLYRGLRGRPMDILHLHYPVHYFRAV